MDEVIPSLKKSVRLAREISVEDMSDAIVRGKG
jgi:hypothetical protein